MPEFASTRYLRQCIAQDNLDPERSLSEAEASLAREGADGSSRLGAFIDTLRQSRSPGITWLLQAARSATKTDGLKWSIQKVIEGPAVVRSPPGSFPAEIEGPGTIGWTDATFKQIIDLAKKALA